MAAEVAIRITADGKAVVTAAKQAEVALEGIGAQADKTAARLKGATQSSEGLDAALQKMGKPGPTGGLSSYVADLDKVGISAKQTANALRGVPAQFTDIVTSLQGGQAPLTVFLQQGGQLKDMFGGAGNAARALGGYVMGLVNPFTVGAAVVGGIAFAYEQGARESRSFQNATTMSGNAVGLSSSQFGAMTQSLSAMAGTRGKAVEALTEIASTGKLAGAEIKNIAEAAILMEKATGQAIDETVAQFVKLADAPAKAVLELNKSYNFLTAAVYSQIKALEEQGNKLGAAELAEKTYADALKARASTVIDNAGLMERAWRGITGAAKGAWDAMLGVGRQASLADKLAAVSAEIAKAQGPFNASAFGDGNAEARAKLPANLALQANLQEMVRLEQRGTEAAAQRNQVQLAGIAGIDAVARANEKAASKQDQMNKALKDYHDGIAAMKAAGASGVPDAKKIADTEAAIRAQYKETAKVASTAGQSEVARIQARVIETESYIQSLKTQGVAAKELNEGEKLAIKIQKELEGGLKGVALANKQKALTAAESLAAVLRESDALKASLKSQREFETLRDKEISGQESSILKLEEKALAMEDEVRMYGLGKQAIEVLSIARLQERIDILEGFSNSAEQIALIEKEIDARKRLAVATDAKAGLDAGVKAAKETDAEWKRTATSIENTLTESLMRSFEKGQSFAKTARDTIVNMFKTMVLRPIVSAIMAPVSGAVGSALGLSGAANAGTGGSDLLGMASNAKSLMSMNTGWFTDFGATAVGSMSSAGAQLYSKGFETFGNAMMDTANSLAQYSDIISGAGDVLGYAGALYSLSQGNYGAAAGAAIGTYFGGPIGAAIGSYIGGLVDRGPKEATGGGIEGSFGNGGFNGNSFSTWKQDGGWFHNDRSGKETGSLDTATAKLFSNGYKAVQTAASQAATALGLSADAVTNYSERISVQLGSDAAANEKAIAKVFGDLGDHMATAVAPGLSALANDGETAGATLSRLAGSLTTANSWLDVLGQTLFDVSLAGGSAASKLADAFGGLDNLSSASKAFYETYSTDAEKVAASQKSMTAALRLVGLALPTSKNELKALAGTLDLNTDAGRKAYATLLALVPQFASTSDLVATLATQTAAALMQTFTGGGKLLPALSATSLSMGDLTGDVTTLSGELNFINTILGDSTSAVIGFASGSYTLGARLSDSQVSAGLLADQIGALKDNADKARVDFAGLSEALAAVDTDTFVATMALVFDSLAARISGVLGDIASERVAVREAALQIINPTVMSKSAIERSIGSINTGLPSNAGVLTGQWGLGVLDKQVAQNSANMAGQKALLASYQDQLAGNKAWLAQTASARVSESAYAELVKADLAQLARNRATAARDALIAQDNRELARVAAEMVQFDDATTAANANINALTGAIASQQNVVNAAVAASNQSVADQAWWVNYAREQQLAYAAALQDFSIDASKSVGKLTRLREETVKYYDAQKALAGLMTTSAATLRTTVSDYKFGQLDPAQQLSDMQTRYATAYSLAMSTDGEVLAGYGDKLNGLLNPLLDKAREVLDGSAYSAFAATMLARADSVASRLELLTPVDYAADSLAMLGNIDTTLAALDASSRSAEKIISDAVAAGADKTANGLRAVIAALTGQSIPAFAAGGAYAGGLALVGERGPEIINFDQPGQVYTAQQTRGMFAGSRTGGADGLTGNTARLEALLARQAQQMDDMRAELRAIATSNAKLARLAEKTDGNGMLVRTDADTPLATVAA